MNKALYTTLLLAIHIACYTQTGVMVDFATNSTAGWAGTNPSQFILAGVNQTLRIITTATGYENLEFSFPPINITTNPTVTLKVQAPTSFILRVDLKDINGRYTNANPVQQTVTASGSFVTYTFNFAGRFNQTYPNSAPVDPTKITGATFFFNPGGSYSNTLYFDDVTVGDPILFNPLSGKILINQVGYEPNCPKIAVYQTDVTSISTDSFYVLNASNQIVHRGLGVYRGAVANWTGRYYWTLDFSNFNIAGTYRLKMKAGDLYSYNFSIHQNVLFNTLAPLVVTFFNGMRHTGTSDNSLSFYGPRNDFVNVYGGWWDATGDPGKHMSHLSYANHFNPQQIPMVVWSLLESYSINPPAYASFAPQLFSEAAWGADYIYRNIDPLGYLYLAIFDDWGNAPATREICEWGQAPACDNCRSANYQAAMREGAGIAIAALAKASYMNLSVGTYTPAQYLAKAQQLYNHLKSPGAGYATKNIEYCNDHTENIIDFYCGLLAATELYKATLNATYLTDAQNYATLLMARQHTNGWLYSDVASTRPFYHAADEGLPVIALIEFASIYPSMHPQIAVFITKWINWYHTITTEVTNPFTYIREYGCPYTGTLQPARKAFFLPHSNETGYWWQGENARIASMAAAMMAAYRFNGPFNFDGGLYSQIVLSQLDWILGKNPFDICMMTGVGTTTYPAYLNGTKKTEYHRRNMQRYHRQKWS